MSGPYGAIHYQAKAEPISTLPAAERHEWRPQPGRPRIVAQYPNRSQGVIPYDIVAAPPAAIQVAWLIDHSRYLDAERVVRRELPFVHMPVVSDRIAWLHDFARVVRQDRLPDNAHIDNAHVIWEEDDNSRYRGLVKYIQ